MSEQASGIESIFCGEATLSDWDDYAKSEIEFLKKTPNDPKANDIGDYQLIVTLIAVVRRQIDFHKEIAGGVHTNIQECMNLSEAALNEAERMLRE